VSEAVQVVLAGTGKMARNVGAWLLCKGLRVAFVGRDPAHIEELERQIERELRSLEGEEISVSKETATFHRFGDPLPRPDVVVECVAESLEVKRSVIKALLAAAPSEALVLSTSSSILPSALHPRCACVHFFYPVQLTGFVELVVPSALPAVPIQEFVRGLELKTIVQSEAEAFAVNRMLLPVQARCVAALRAGASTADVDAASKSRLLPVGQLALMDAIGLDTVGASISNYLTRMRVAQTKELAPLRDGVLELVKMGKLGQKNGDGFLCGRALPWAVGSEPLQPGFGEALARLFDETCARFIAREEIAESDLRVALTGLFGVEWAAR